MTIWQQSIICQAWNDDDIDKIIDRPKPNLNYRLVMKSEIV